MGDIPYGNARVRAHKAELLDPGAFAALLRPENVDGLVAELGARPAYRRDVEAAWSRGTGTTRLDEALRRHRGRTLRTVVDWYRGDPVGGELARLLDRIDLENLRTLFRGLAGLHRPDALLVLLVPAGRLDEGALRTLAESGGVRDAVERLVVWSLPDRATARGLLAALPRYEASGGDPRVLEAALDQAWGEALAARPVKDPALSRALREPLDRINLGTALRLRDAARRGEPAGAGVATFVPGGGIPVSRFAGVTDAADRADALRALGPTPGFWGPPLARWRSGGDAAALADDLDRAARRAQVTAFWRGDPLSLAIPVAYLAAKEEELRTLRRLGRGLADGVPPHRLVPVEEGAPIA